MIAQAPWSFLICIFVVGGIIFLVLRALKAQEIADLKSRLDLRIDEITDYRRRLDGASPEEAGARMDDLEAQLARLQPRRLTAGQRRLISAAVAGQGLSVSIQTDMASVDARGLATDFSSAFQDAGWTVRPSAIFGLVGAPPSGTGVRVADVNNLTAPQLDFLRALREIGVPFDVIGGGVDDVPGAAPTAFEILLTTAVR